MNKYIDDWKKLWGLYGDKWDDFWDWDIDCPPIKIIYEDNKMKLYIYNNLKEQRYVTDDFLKQLQEPDIIAYGIDNSVTYIYT